ncbi:Protein of unknown function, partial [Gryllus bimaculatus]
MSRHDNRGLGAERFAGVQCAAMGSAPQVRAAAGALLSVTVVWLALGTTLVALLLAPVVRAAQSGEGGDDSGETDTPSGEGGDNPGSPDDDCCWLDREICNEPCRIFPNNICDCCAPSHGVNKPPHWCHRGPPDNAFYLVAQI